ncbi:hypothetical protein L1887_47753 [Cichorium endivia]|nr:hypothetical protein L1887_47753 [Cichorium endivia]
MWWCAVRLPRRAFLRGGNFAQVLDRRRVDSRKYDTSPALRGRRGWRKACGQSGEKKRRRRGVVWKEENAVRMGGPAAASTRHGARRGVDPPSAAAAHFHRDFAPKIALTRPTAPPPHLSLHLGWTLTLA